ncbi:acyl-protein thioesterase 1 [Moniliophthora roreri MCA 2997]|uniref:Acyl-protein thioesterase 1 n=1 Tax=Moniliophthora roreri (strain MCA 2997) TaxID=1381753 RepID=V2WZ08_MONRO|nr:acyl-protein thioesterase 1 [Moniliophthora roreri MCA 2997]
MTTSHQLFQAAVLVVLVFIAADYLDLLKPNTSFQMSANTPEFLEVPALTKHTATVIFIHGLGDTGYGWKPVADMFQKDAGLGHVKWVLPHAPNIPVTINQGEAMPAWYDIATFGRDKDEDEEGMMKAKRAITALIEREVATGTPLERIVLGGFSQGAVTTLLTGLTIDKKLAGLAPLSGRLPLMGKFKELMSPHATSIPIFWGHGTADPIVSFKFAEESVELLQSLGFTVIKGGKKPEGLSFNVYKGLPHSTDPFELMDLKAWLKQVIPPTD